MSIPSSYTETTLADYMNDTLKNVADLLGWSPANNDYAEAINETLLSCGVDLISEITGREAIRRMRAFARMHVWQSVVNATAGNYDFSADAGRFNRSQIHEQALENLQAAQVEVLSFNDQYRVGVDTLDFKHDPYQYRDEEDRTL